MLANLKTMPLNSYVQNMLRRVAKPAALAAILVATASAANAAECVNGYRTLPNEVIFLCDDGALSERQALLPETAAPAARPLAGGAETGPSGAMLVDDIADCQPGMYRMIYGRTAA